MNAAPKENLALRTEERWRPPTFKPVVGWRARFGAAVRRFFDLQAGSLWRDLGPVLTRARGTLVDVGCGAQPYRGLLRGDAVYVGLDTERAREDFGYAMPDVLLIGEDGRWPLDDSRADFVLATETLEHVIEPRAFLAEAHRGLTPGGASSSPSRSRPDGTTFPTTTGGSPRQACAAARAGRLRGHRGSGRGNEPTVACYKLLALLLPLVLPQSDTGAMRVRPLGMLIAPLVVILAALGNLSLRGRTGDDCLGFTTFASKPR